MTKSGYILSLDQGTTGTTAMLIDSTGAPLWTVSREIRQIHPRPGWVEHDPRELFESCLETTEELLEMSEMHPRSIVAIGITNQRETLVMWDRRTGEPVANAIVWQCRRSAPICERLKSEGLEETVRSKTGLPIDPYFTGAKIRWLLDNIPDGQRRAQHGDLACGTVDSWLVWNLTNKLVHATDATNASRTMLFDIDAMRWDPELLSALEVPAAILPEVRTSSEIYGYVSGDLSSGQPIPIAGIAGDQQASLFGQACFEPGSAKNTYGTGCFVLTNTGNAQSRVNRRTHLNSRLDARRRDDLRPRRQHLLRWLYHPVAQRRPRADLRSRRVRRPSPAECPTTAACTSFPPSMDSALPTGTPTRAELSWA